MQAAQSGASKPGGLRLRKPRKPRSSGNGSSAGSASSSRRQHCAWPRAGSASSGRLHPWGAWPRAASRWRAQRLGGALGRAQRGTGRRGASGLSLVVNHVSNHPLDNVSLQVDSTAGRWAGGRARTGGGGGARTGRVARAADPIPTARACVTLRAMMRVGGEECGRAVGRGPCAGRARRRRGRDTLLR